MNRDDTVIINEREVPVFHCGIEPTLAKRALSSKKFQDWLMAINGDERSVCRAIELQSIDFFDKAQTLIGFIKFKADLVYPDGSFMSGITFCRGGAVTVLVVLTSKLTGIKYGVLTLQPRTPIGRYEFPELPAGMIDDAGNIVGVAAAELKQETGIVINEDDPKLVDLTKWKYGCRYSGVYPSPGACDEFIRVFMYEDT